MLLIVMDRLKAFGEFLSVCLLGCIFRSGLFWLYFVNLELWLLLFLCFCGGWFCILGGLFCIIMWDFWRLGIVLLSLCLLLRFGRGFLEF